VYDPVSHLLNAVDRADVTHVWVAGAPLVADGELSTLDVAALAATARAWHARLQ
jgi:5-methylthioadenosine/S-adenosylhomocysteine deaminase